MNEPSRFSWFDKLKILFVGRALNPHDHSVFHQLSLIAFFAWVGLGADGLSSTCYGPSEAFQTLAQHPHLSVFVALATAITIMVLTASESQVVEMFSSGGGGYVVASKLLNPSMGMVAGCALLIDYVLTIAISIASGTDAIFSFMPTAWVPAKPVVCIAVLMMLTIMNLRGVKESVNPLVPVFLTFVGTHAFALIYALVTQAPHMGELVTATAQDVRESHSQLGAIGLILLVLRAYGMGAGTFTGIEAVSSSMMILREPRVKTAQRTLRYMSVSLAITATGLFLAYLLYAVKLEGHKTINAVLFERITAGWSGNKGHWFILVTLVSEALILFIAAQSGFLSGPRILASMAVDRWVPTRFASLSDRLVTHNGVLLMGGAALATLLLTRGNVTFLVVLYSINVFITLGLSQLGMVKHAWPRRKTDAVWMSRFRVNGAALTLTLFILATMVVMKFFEGGWITLLVTGALIVIVSFVRRYYTETASRLKRLDSLVEATDIGDDSPVSADQIPAFDPKAKTAVLMVGGFNGFGLHTLFAIRRLFGDTFKNFVFMQVGLIDAGNFKGTEEIAHLQKYVDKELKRYVTYMQRHGYYAESVSRLGLDALDEISQLAPDLIRKYKNPVFFGGQLAFPDEMVYARWFHNYLVFAVQGRLHNLAIPFFIVPIRVDPREKPAKLDA